MKFICARQKTTCAPICILYMYYTVYTCIVQVRHSHTLSKSEGLHIYIELCPRNVASRLFSLVPALDILLSRNAVFCNLIG